MSAHARSPPPTLPAPLPTPPPPPPASAAAKPPPSPRPSPVPWPPARCSPAISPQAALASAREELASREADRAAAEGRLRALGLLVGALEREQGELREQVGCGGVCSGCGAGCRQEKPDTVAGILE